MARVVHFEIPCSDPNISQGFYANVFGWEVERYNNQDYWQVKTGDENLPGIDGALIQKAGKKDSQDAEMVSDAAHAINAVITIDVKSLDKTIEAALKNGGRVAMEKWRVEGVGYLAYIADPDGNLLGVMQSD